MGGKVKEVSIDRRDSRRKLTVRTEPYWRLMSEGEHLGYYRGTRVGKWVARFRRPGTTGGYLKTTLGEADDSEEADGERWLNFRQAQERARAWFAEVARSGRRPAGPYTVGDALDDYLKAFRGKSLAKTKSRVESVIRPDLGAIEIAKLTKKQIARGLPPRLPHLPGFVLLAGLKNPICVLPKRPTLSVVGSRPQTATLRYSRRH